MKRIVLYALILALVQIAPVERTDIAKLRPVEVIALYSTGDSVRIATDTGDFGDGENVLSALDHMRRTSPSVIYLDTAEFLLVAPGAEEALESLRDELKPSVRLCRISQPVDLQATAEYLDVHGDLPSLRHWEVGQKLPVLTDREGRFCILKTG